ncbi:hypothetical protein BN1221_03274 [Brenneria goodwinii]|uniref:Uncharacterized protein n=1 Tax=Brenneria goodwinii TaxID=1109412 RepID=A0A0G4JYL5_9GAMM|nr:hypothetical protein BN1221_03274 [Brenneria goodwinii]
MPGIFASCSGAPAFSFAALGKWFYIICCFLIIFCFFIYQNLIYFIQMHINNR